MEPVQTKCSSHGWLDQIAISLAALCAVHCLLTPVLIAILPIIATSFFVHQDFHFWMLLFVVPTTGFAVFMGCRKHKDKWVGTLSALGLSILIVALVCERQNKAAYVVSAENAAHCEHCVRDATESPLPTHAAAWFNTLGGLFLAGGHVRNFRLCRKNKCAY
ncbi:MAG: MerC domain-containing protein [Coraliomargarita sp.]|nr:MerC domain-containing protein [Coraliomargarita sp.]